MKFSHNKTSSKKVVALYLAVAFFFTLFSFGKIANAEVISQTVFDTSTPGTSASDLVQYYGPSSTGALNAIRIKGDFRAGQEYCLWAGKSDFSDFDYDDDCVMSGPSPIGGQTLSPGNATFNFSSLNVASGGGSNFFYLIVIDTGYGNANKPVMYGTAASGGSNGITGGSGCCGSVQQLWYNIYTQSDTPPPATIPDTTSQPIITETFPYSGYATTTTTINFNVKGYSYATSTVTWLFQNYDNATYYSITYPTLEAGEEAFNLSTTTLQFSQYPPGASCGITPGTSCGTSATTTLAQGTYSGYAQIVDVNGQMTNVEVSFIVGSSAYSEYYPPSSGILLPGTTFTSGTTTTGLSANNLLSFLNVPELLKTKIPFGYIPLIKNAIETGIATTTAAKSISTGILPVAIKINWTANGSYSTSTFQTDLFSTSTVTRYMSDGIRDLLRGIMVAVTWISMGYLLYHDARSKKNLI